MKKYYLLVTLSVVAIVAIQYFYIESLYCNYLQTESIKIESAIDQAIDLEFFHRRVKREEKVKFKVRRIKMSDMSKEMLDSLLAIQPLPVNPPQKTIIPPEHDIVALINSGVIKKSGEIGTHEAQDEQYEKGKPILLHVLDSLLLERLGHRYSHQIEIRNQADSLLASVGKVTAPNFESKQIQIGFKGYQFIRVWMDIPPSAFIKEAVWTLLASLLCITIPLLALLFLVTTLRWKEKQLRMREEGVNGIIHDLKSPLASVSTMLSLLKLTETDATKRALISKNSLRIAQLIQQVERLLDVCSFKRSQVVVSQSAVTAAQLVERVELIKELLLLSYSTQKSCIIRVSHTVQSDGCLQVDVSHFDTIITTLLDNALKYSGQAVEVAVLLTTNTPDTLSIKVTDNGFGIPAGAHKRIFKQFYRIPHPGIKGYGIGLSYLRAIALANSGSVTLTSEVGKGSEFEVTIKSTQHEE